MMQKRYRWKHLHYDALIICLVSTTEEGVLPVARTMSSLPTNILHHRLDLMLQTVVNKETLCIYRNRIATLCKKINSFIPVANYLQHIIRYLKSYIFYFIFSNWCSLFISMVLSISNGATGTIRNWFSYDCTKLYGIHQRFNGSFS